MIEDRLTELLEHAVKAGDAETSLHALAALRRELDAFERVQAWRALEAGSSYGAVARALGISRQAAHRRYRELADAAEPPTGAPALRVTPEARAAVQLAGDEAKALGASRIGSEHLLLGILRAGDPRAAGALRQHGVRLEAARLAAQPTLVADEDDGTPAITAYARRVFGEAMRQAAADRHAIDVADLLAAALRERGGGACRTLEALGVDAAAIQRDLA
ncbi:Clp protease N-terminal domain-containing protein [Candidatus Solirubrobacter pratensis]|uniref:Clp protease N-terminal domain-containing protein n=1 Tax=Candidatus Solirubrobacter pratensis TaxID=1298857 RepID=UPI0004133C75|nr:Clp protease N-terminal domain-containing protein [Candidatus Solirubrobacter pratensis]